MPRPDLSTVPAFFHNYVNQVTENDLFIALKNQSTYLTSFFENIPAGKHDYAYAEGKWTLKDVLQHIIDAERIFAYRALRIARNDKTPLPGFDENLFAETANASARTWDDLVAELKAVRITTEMLFNSFNEKQLHTMGTASNNPINALIIGFVCVGHYNHHKRIIEERYL